MATESRVAASVDSCEGVLNAIASLQDAAVGTECEAHVQALVEALAADTTVVALRQEIEFVRAEGEATAAEALACLHAFGWMPNADSPYWCFCPAPGGPEEPHTDVCVRTSALMARVGDVGEAADPPTREQLIGVADAFPEEHRKETL